MLRIALCDDEAITLDHYYKCICQILDLNRVSYVIDCFTDSGKLLSQIYSNKQWDIYLLDIDMPLINGLDLGKKIRETDRNCYLIYISIHRECVYDSLRVRPFRFIPKDEFHTKIDACFQDLLAEYKKDFNEDAITIETPNAIHRFHINEIIYVQSMDKYITLALVGDQTSESIRYKLSDMENLLVPHGFIRIHKSYLVNYRFIKSIQSGHLVLTTNMQLPVSRYRLNDIKNRFRRLTL